MGEEVSQRPRESDPWSQMGLGVDTSLGLRRLIVLRVGSVGGKVRLVRWRETINENRLFTDDPLKE